MDKQGETKVFVRRDYIDNRGGFIIKNVEHFHGTPPVTDVSKETATAVSVEPVQFIEEISPVTDEKIKNAINILMNMNSKKIKRWWFAVYRVLKDINKVADITGFEAYVNKIFDGNLPLKLDAHDLRSKMEVGTLGKPFLEWDEHDGLTDKGVFKTYSSLVTTFRSLIGLQ